VSFYFGVCIRVCFLFTFIFCDFQGVFICGSCRGGKNEVVALCQKCV